MIDLVAGLLGGAVLAVILLLLVLESDHRQAYHTALQPMLGPNLDQIQDQTQKDLARMRQRVGQITAERIQQYHAQNDAAQRRAIQALNECFDKYKQGIPAFVADVTSLSGRYHLLKRQMQQWADNLWSDADTAPVAEYVQALFEQHIFSDTRLQQDISGVLHALAFELEANQNRLVADVREVVLQSGLPVDVTRFTMAHYRQHLPALQRAAFTHIGQQSLATLADSLAVDLGAGYLVCRYMPHKVYVCIAVTLVISVLVDWVLTEQLQQQLTQMCHEIVTAVHRAVLYDTHNGLAPRLEQNLNQILQANLTTTHNLLQGR